MGESGIEGGVVGLAEITTKPVNDAGVFFCHFCGESGILEQLLPLLNGGFTELPVHTARVVDQSQKFGTCLFGGHERLPSAAVSFIGKVFCKGRAGPAHAKTPSFKSGGIVGESGEVFSRL